MTAHRLQKLAIAGAVSLSAGLLAHPGMESALHHYEHLIAASPGQVKPYADRARLLIHEGQTLKALADIHNIEHIGSDFNTGYLRGLVALRSGDPATAVKELDRFLAAFPDNADALTARGQAHLSRGDRELALADFLDAIDHQTPFSPGLITDTAKLAAALDQTGLALRLIEDANTTRGMTPQLQLCAVQILVAQDRIPEALAELNKLIARAGENPQWLVRKAQFLFQMDNPESAQDVLDMAEQAIAGRKQTPWRQAKLAEIAELRARANTSK